MTIYNTKHISLVLSTNFSAIRHQEDIQGKMYRLDVMMGMAKFNNKHYEGYMSKIGGTKAKPV
jgi:hypothetical protein